MRDYTALLPADAIACLKLADDGRRFPFRPLSSGLFLIGSGASCDLRLGGGGIPSLHSRIEICGRSANISCIGDSPGLFINGQPAVSARLSEGDLIEIGEFRAVFQYCHPHAVQLPLDLEITSAVFPGGTGPASQSSVGDAVLEKVAERTRDRIRELLISASQSAEVPATETLRLEEYLQHRKLAGKTVETIPAEVLFRMEGLDQRMAETCQTLREVIRQQQLVITAMQNMVEQMEFLRVAAPMPSAPLRASA